MKKVTALALLIAVGSEKNAAVVPGAPEMSVTSKAYTFTPKEIRVIAGTDVTLVLTTSDLPHDITIEGIGHIAHASSGKPARGGLKIMRPGTYVFYCSVKGHRAEGMTGTIIAS